MATNKPKRKRQPLITSAAGTLQFTHLVKADAFEEGSQPKYSTRLVVSELEAQEMIQKIITAFEEIAPTVLEKPAVADKIRRKALAVGVEGGEDSIPWGRALNKEKEPTTGIYFSFRIPETYTSKKGEVYDNRPVFFDRHGRVIPTADVPRFGFGTVARINFDVFPYAGFGGGINLRPREVQLIEIVELTRQPTGFGSVEPDDAAEKSTDRAGDDSGSGDDSEPAF